MVAKTKHMDMNIQVTVTESDYEAIKQFADFNGKSISALVLDAIWEQIEYWEDLKAIEEYEEEKANGTLVTYSMQEVKERLGLFPAVRHESLTLHKSIPPPSK